MIRRPIVSGRFYPSSPANVEREIDACLQDKISVDMLPNEILGGLVPHAGWVCSGAVAGKTFQAVKYKTEVETFVLFGAVHQYGVNQPALYSSGSWETPLGQVEVDEELAKVIIQNSNVIVSSQQAHLGEHSIEVQVPFIRRLFPRAKIVPIMVPPDSAALQVGNDVAKAILSVNKNIVCIGSTDLTHYGPSYGFTPQGIGQAGIRWAKEVNDAGLIDLILKLDAEAALQYARRTHSACGAGAIAATISAVVALGADKAVLLEHTTSYEVLGKAYGEFGNDSVGYASVVFGR